MKIIMVKQSEFYLAERTIKILFFGFMKKMKPGNVLVLLNLQTVYVFNT